MSVRYNDDFKREVVRAYIKIILVSGDFAVNLALVPMVIIIILKILRVNIMSSVRSSMKGLSTFTTTIINCRTQSYACIFGTIWYSYK